MPLPKTIPVALRNAIVDAWEEAADAWSKKTESVMTHRRVVVGGRTVKVRVTVSKEDGDFVANITLIDKG